MSTIGVFPEVGTSSRVFRAVSGDRHGVGVTIGEAVDNLAGQLGEPEGATLIVVQPFKPDRFFTAEQIKRLSELMAKWRSARDSGATLPADEKDELDSLVDAELEATIERTKALVATGRV